DLQLTSGCNLGNTGPKHTLQSVRRVTELSHDRVANHRVSRAICAARLSKSISVPAAGNGCGSRYQSSVNEAEPPGGMLLRGPCGSSSQTGSCAACGYQKQRVRPAISGYTPSGGEG